MISSEKVSSGGSLAHYRCGKFLDWIFKQRLMDLGFLGSKFTWFRDLSSSTFKRARLNSWLCNVDWKSPIRPCFALGLSLSTALDLSLKSFLVLDDVVLSSKFKRFHS